MSQLDQTMERLRSNTPNTHKYTQYTAIHLQKPFKNEKHMTGSPRPKKLTQEDIFKAADAIRDRGDNVTQDAVRQECGGRGSFSTINKHLQVWRQENEAITARISREITPELNRLALDLVAQISEHLAKEANMRCASMEAGHKATMSELETTLIAACDEADQYLEASENAEARIEELQIEIAALKAESSKQVKIIEALKGEIQNLETAKDAKDLRIQQDQRKISGLETKLAQALTSAGRSEGTVDHLKERVSEQNDNLTKSARSIGAYEESLARADENCG